MTKLSSLFDLLDNLTTKDGQSEFVSVIITNLINHEDTNKPAQDQDDVDSYQLLREFLAKIFAAIDELSNEILNDSSILISVKNQKLIRLCFQLITFGISTCLIFGSGIPLTKTCPSSMVLPQLNFKDEEKYELLVECTSFFTRSYKIPVLKNIIITLHLSDYLAALTQLSFAPLKNQGSIPTLK